MWDCTVTFVTVCCVTYVLRKIFSREPNTIKFHFYFCLLYMGTILVAFVIWPYFLLRPRNVKNLNVSAQILKHMTKLCGVKWDLRNGEILSEERGAVIVSNHQSSLDVLGIFNVWNVVGKLTIITKKELFYVWPFGLSAYLGGIVFINRRNAKKAYEQLDITSQVMVQNKTKVWVFPEGTRNKDYTKFLPFKKGAFIMAVKAQVPIIPVLFSPYYFVNAKKHIFNRGHVVIKCLDPLPTKGLTMDGVPDLMNLVHERMRGAYVELTKEVLSALPSDYPHTTVG